MTNMLSMQNMHMEGMMPSQATAAHSLAIFSGDDDLHTPMPCCDVVGQFSGPCMFVASQAHSDIQAGESERVAQSLLVIRSITLGLLGPPPKI